MTNEEIENALFMAGDIAKWVASGNRDWFPQTTVISRALLALAARNAELEARLAAAEECIRRKDFALSNLECLAKDEFGFSWEGSYADAEAHLKGVNASIDSVLAERAAQKEGQP